MAGGVAAHAGLGHALNIAPNDWSAVDAIAEAAVLARVTPGLQICLRRDGEILYSRGFGLGNLETGTVVGPASVFRIGSVTKEFTAALVLPMAEKGQLGLGDPLARFLPRFPLSGVTVSQLLTHTSGLSNYTSTMSAEEYLRQSGQERSMQEMIDIVSQAQPLAVSEAGAGWAYSNSGYILLGAVIEHVTGSYAEAMDQMLAPLNLRATAVDDGTDVVPGRVSGYFAKPQAAAGFANAPYAAMSYAGASGAVRSTAEDLCRWRSALLDGRVLGEKALAFMTTPVRLQSGELPRDGSGSEVRYGGGVFLDPLDGQPALRGGGAIQGFVATCDTAIAAKQTLAILLNVDGNGAEGLPALTRDLKRAVRQVLTVSQA